MALGRMPLGIKLRNPLQGGTFLADQRSVSGIYPVPYTWEGLIAYSRLQNAQIIW